VSLKEWVIEDTASLPFRLNVTATLLGPAIMPFTVLVMKPVNDQLFQRDKIGEPDGEMSTKVLIDRWTVLHLVRTGITGVGALMAVWAVVVGEGRSG
jgi:hypothetical protein